MCQISFYLHVHTHTHTHVCICIYTAMPMHSEEVKTIMEEFGLSWQKLSEQGSGEVTIPQGI